MLGLSILIPVYNRDVTSLVRSLLGQVADWGGPVDIHCLDDGSAEQFRCRNRVLAELPGVSYQELPQNIGRSAVRNRLAAAARQPWLLLLDNNVSLPDSQFLARYAAVAAATAARVVVGGTIYAAAPPPEAATHLRWHYGRHREAHPAQVRQQRPHAQFKLKNVLLRADVFRPLQLDENLTRYGHEDTKFGWQLHVAGVAVAHLDNPVLHTGLESTEIFLLHSKQAVQNLVQLFRAEGLGTDSKLLQTALWVRRCGLAGLVSAILSRAEARLLQHLSAAQPQLQALDLLKLLWALRALR